MWVTALDNMADSVCIVDMDSTTGAKMEATDHVSYPRIITPYEFRVGTSCQALTGNAERCSRRPKYSAKGYIALCAQHARSRFTVELVGHRNDPR